MEAAGFSSTVEQHLWETRMIHRDLEDLEQDLLQRTGRSILHELSDEELHQLNRHIRQRLTEAGLTAGIPDRDRWSFWITRKHSP